MKDKIIRGKWTNNLGMKILSLAFAAVIWIVIVNIADPVISLPFYNIPVTLKNENAIKQLNKVYEIISGGEVTITVKGKKSMVDSIRKTDLMAVADLSELSPTYAVQIRPQLNRVGASSLDLSLNQDTLKLQLENKAEKTMAVKVEYKGEVEKGYAIGKSNAKPNLVTIEGAESQIKKIHHVSVEIKVNGASDDINTSGVPIAYDENNNPLDSSKLKFVNTESVDVYIELLKTKMVDLNITTVGEPFYGHRQVDIQYEPASVLIAGEPEIIEKINQISVDELNIQSAIVDVEEEINIEKYLPEGVKLADDNKSVMVRVVIEKLKEENITFQTSDIEILNLPDNMKLNYVTNNELVIRVHGLQSDLKKIKAGDLNPYIDVKGLKEGVHTVIVGFGLENSGINIVNMANVKIRLTKERPEEEREEESTPNNNEAGGNEIIPPEVNTNVEEEEENIPVEEPKPEAEIEGEEQNTDSEEQENSSESELEGTPQ